jgi:hypothetical protein
MAVAGGPTLSALAEELTRKKLLLGNHVAIAKAESQKASNLNPRLSPTEIQDLPSVVEANGRLAELRLEVEPRIKELESRLKTARAVLDGR